MTTSPADDFRDSVHRPRHVPADLQALERALANQSCGVHAYLELQTGDVLWLEDGITNAELAALVRSDPECVPIERIHPRQLHRWIEEFIASCKSARVAGALIHAIRSRHPVRRVNAVLAQHDAEAVAWAAFRTQRYQRAASAWLTARGIFAIPRSAHGRRVDGRAAKLDNARARHALEGLLTELEERELDALDALATFLKDRS
jgi:hypothetical protein